MTAAAVTVVKRATSALPGEEKLQVTLASDGDWYDSNLSKPVTCQITQLGTIGASDAYSVASISGNRITFKAVGTTAPTLMLTISE